MHAYTGTSTVGTTIPTSAWAVIPSLGTGFTSNGGPVEIGVSINTIAGSTTTCSPLVDGNTISADPVSEPDNYNNFWNEGLLTSVNGSWWHMWNRVRVYRGIAAGSHQLTLQCRTDSGTVSVGSGGVANLWAVAYDQ